MRGQIRTGMALAISVLLLVVTGCRAESDTLSDDAGENLAAADAQDSSTVAAAPAFESEGASERETESENGGTLIVESPPAAESTSTTVATGNTETAETTDVSTTAAPSTTAVTSATTATTVATSAAETTESTETTATTAPPTTVPATTGETTSAPTETTATPAGTHPDIVKVIPVAGRNPGGNSWKDSYSVGTVCYCSTTFDHNIGGIQVDTPAGKKTVREVCEAIGDGPGPNGHPIYNDIQCGNGPANDAGDETDCPGRVDIGREGCGHIGPTWDLTVFQ